MTTSSCCIVRHSVSLRGQRTFLSDGVTLGLFSLANTICFAVRHFGMGSYIRFIRSCVLPRQSGPCLVCHRVCATVGFWSGQGSGFFWGCATFSVVSCPDSRFVVGFATITNVWCVRRPVQNKFFALEQTGWFVHERISRCTECHHVQQLPTSYAWVGP